VHTYNKHTRAHWLQLKSRLRSMIATTSEHTDTLLDRQTYTNKHRDTDRQTHKQ